MSTTTTPERTHDERLLALFTAAAKAEQTLGWKLAVYRSESNGGRHIRNDTRTIAEVAADMQARRVEARSFWTAKDHEDPERMIAYVIGKLNKAEYAYLDAAADVRNAEAAIAEHEVAYTGWQRFFLVTSSAGLVHRDTHCSTCNKGRKATTFALLASLSGQTVADLVEAVGPALCSVCFPFAPVAWTDDERIPARIAQVLLDEGVEAFTTELANFKNKRAARAAKKGTQS